tara:strand:- start:28 stop:324 length:297 start_codon:yes stop_codon:yes gene_type:complete
VEQSHVEEHADSQQHTNTGGLLQYQGGNMDIQKISLTALAGIALSLSTGSIQAQEKLSMATSWGGGPPLESWAKGEMTGSFGQKFWGPFLHLPKEDIR